MNLKKDFTILKILIKINFQLLHKQQLIQDINFQLTKMFLNMILILMSLKWIAMLRQLQVKINFKRNGLHLAIMGHLISQNILIKNSLMIIIMI